MRLYRNIIVPKPVYDLLAALGRGFNHHDGHHYYMTPVAQPNANPPNWWQIDNGILTNYQQFSRRMSPLYQEEDVVPHLPKKESKDISRKISISQSTSPSSARSGRS